jgi:hypothetical protein
MNQEQLDRLRTMFMNIEIERERILSKDIFRRFKKTMALLRTRHPSGRVSLDRNKEEV